jgi:hypothetical protein
MSMPPPRTQHVDLPRDVIRQQPQLAFTDSRSGAVVTRLGTRPMIPDPELSYCLSNWGSTAAKEFDDVRDYQVTTFLRFKDYQV